MRHSTFLSIITVTRNCFSTLDRTLKSVARIKSQGIEYIVVDGDSSDGTLELLYNSRHLVDTLLSEPDTGIYNAMNKGVRLARGQYILFINGDDELIEQGFPAVIEALMQGKYPIICAKTKLGTTRSSSEVLSAQPWRLPYFNSVPHPSSFVDRNLLLRWPFREDLRIASDYDFFLNAYLSGVGFKSIPVVTALHQRGGASGDVALSRIELEHVRRERLGWRYFYFNMLAGLYRYGKRLICIQRHS